MIRTWSLHDDRQSLVLAAGREHLPEVVYFGPRLPEGENSETLFKAYGLDVTGGMLDANPELSICPEATRSFPGQPGLIIRDGDGTPLLPKFCYESEEVDDRQLVLTYRDETHRLT